MASEPELPDVLDLDFDLGEPARRRALETPRKVYHYTSEEAFAGIVDSGCLWATSHRHLNDSREFSHGFDLVLALLDEQTAGEPHPFLRTFFTHVKAMIESAGQTWYAFYVACLCEEYESPSQWQSYAAGGSGVCFSVHPWYLGPPGRTFHYTRVLYDLQAQRELLSHPLATVRRFLLQHLEHGSVDQTVAEHAAIFTYRYLIHWMATVKEAKWAHEREWRAMLQVGENEQRFVRRRASAAGLVPFITFEGRNEIEFGGRLPLLDVTVGPKSDADAVERLSRFLSSRSYDVEVRRSSLA
jgi:hypothetical protein